MGRESHGICVPGHESRDLGPGLGLILLGLGTGTNIAGTVFFYFSLFLF